VTVDSGSADAPTFETTPSTVAPAIPSPDAIDAHGDVGQFAEHNGPVGDEELIETQTMSIAGTEPGVVEVTLDYHIGDDISRLQIYVENNTEVTGLEGFSPLEDADYWYEWDGQTAEPSITLDKPVNQTSSRLDGLDFVGTDDWAFTDNVWTYAYWWAPDPESINYFGSAQPGETGGISGQNWIYLGDYERHEFESDSESFQLIVTEEANPETSVEEVGQRLVESSEMFDVGSESATVTAFVVSNPLRRGGRASGADLWVHEDSLWGTTLRHEYIHTRQNYSQGSEVDWTSEASANYFAYLLALKQDYISYHEFRRKLLDGRKYRYGVTLGDPGTWEDSLADYNLGSLVLANLDARIRDTSGGSGTLEDVFRRMNGHEGNVTGEEFETYVRETAGTSLSTFFENQIHSEADPLSVPPPTAYTAPSNDASLDVSVSSVQSKPDDETTLRFEVTNTGSDPSIAPYLEITVPPELTWNEFVSIESTDVSPEVTRVDGGRVYSNIAPGETLVLETTVTVPEVVALDTYNVQWRVTDMGGNEVDANSTIEVISVPDAGLSAPESTLVGETTLLDASGTNDKANIATYHWKIAGPDGNLTETTEPQLEYAFAEPGEHTLTVTAVNEFGESDTAERTVIVNDQPELSVDAPSSVTVEKPLRLSVDVTNEVGEYEVSWSTGEQSATGETAEFTFAEARDHDVTVTVEDEYGLTATETVTISVTPEATGTGTDGDSPDNRDSETVDDNDGEQGESGGDGPTAGVGGAGFGVAVALAGVTLCLLTASRRDG